MTATGFLRGAAFACASLFSGFLAGAQPTLPVEKVPTFLGIDLPLRAGERLLPIGDGPCSVIEFLPQGEPSQTNRDFWKGAEWIGACRFGLAHGKGYAHHLETDTFSEVYMLYGTMVEPFAKLSWTSLDGGGTADRQTEYFYSGPAFHDLSTRSLIVYGFDYFEDTTSLATIAKYWGWDSFMFAYRFNEAGEKQMSYYGVMEVSPYCGGTPPAFLSAFAKELKKACAKKDYDKHVLVRRDGTTLQPYDQAPVVWLKSCPIDKTFRINDCGELLEEAAGQDLATINAMLTGNKAMRASAEAEILVRYAPLERALDARLASAPRQFSAGSNAGGAQ